MGTTTRRRPHRIAMTPGARKVREAAGRLFYAHGIHAVGVDLIAAEAGVTKKTLYDRFGSKDQIVVEYLAERDERWRALLEEHVEAAEAPAARVLAVFDAAAEWASAHGARGCSMVNAHAEIDDPGHPAFVLIYEAKHALLDRLSELVAAVDARADAELPRALLLLYEGALVAHGLGLTSEPFATARAQAARLLGDGGGSAA